RRLARTDGHSTRLSRVAVSPVRIACRNSQLARNGEAMNQTAPRRTAALATSLRMSTRCDLPTVNRNDGTVCPDWGRVMSPRALCTAAVETPKLGQQPADLDR